jgi:hypothetical protein
MEEPERGATRPLEEINCLQMADTDGEPLFRVGEPNRVTLPPVGLTSPSSICFKKIERNPV